MPAPYRLLDMPPGEYSNPFDHPAMDQRYHRARSSYHRGQSTTFHAFLPDSDPSIFITTWRRHYFVAMEEKLGQGTLTQNVEEHTTFVPKLEETEKWLKDVQTGREKYDGQVCLEKINSFADLMVAHLEHIPTLSRETLRAVFTEKELKVIDAELMKETMKDLDFYTTVPLTFACANPATPWFPPIPAPMRWATRWWFSRRHKEAWEFGTTDFSGNLRQLPLLPPSDQ